MKHGKSHDHHHRHEQTPDNHGELPVPVAQEPAATEPASLPAQPPVPAPATEVAPSELDQLKDRLLRLQADFENFRKRTARERADTIRRANADLLMDLLPCIDNLDRALEQAKTLNLNDPFVAGVRMVLDQLQGALRKHGVTTFDATGQSFDVTRHEAVSHMPTADYPENSVIAQTRKGYLLGDILLRPAQVIVAMAMPEPAAAAPAEPINEETAE